jgi:hypothetical protein
MLDKLGNLDKAVPSTGRDGAPAVAICSRC